MAQLEGLQKELKGERSGTELTALLESRDELEEKRKALRYRVSGICYHAGRVSKDYQPPGTLLLFPMRQPVSTAC
ncbi:hypothetical protein STSR3_28 [Salmonella virus STSR3]|nr:hypothetical protein STSR3_28 [Salmonella virus STSR3]